MAIVTRQATADDADWIADLLMQRWGGTAIVVHGEMFDLLDLPAIVADPALGLATYRLTGAEAELMSLDAVSPGQGVGTRLIESLVRHLQERGVPRLWVTTTNDNMTALRFYQQRGFQLRRIRTGAVGVARLLKPSIPEIGDHGIPIRDELDLCRPIH